MKRIISMLLVLIMGVSFCACGKESDSLRGDYERGDDIPVYDFTSEEITTPDGYEDFVNGTTEFSFKLLSAVADNEGNTVISPLSAATALSVLANGAESNTRKQLRKALCSGEDISVINSGSYYLNSRLSAFNTQESYLTAANSLWLDDSFDVKSSFLQSAVNYYDTEISRILLAQGEETINKWISDKTDGEITDAVGEIKEDTLLLIVNAVLFDDEWATPYDESDISDGIFHGTKGDKEAFFMTSNECYLETSYAQGFTKGFANLPLKFAAIMPNEDIDIDTFAENLSRTRWQALLESQQPTLFCKASIPEFDLKVKTDLNEPLQKMGITDMFDAEKSDFSALSNSNKVYVSSVSQDAFVKINSRGAKAGAATVINGKTTSALPADMKELKFDKPFIFVIYDNESGIPVFTGVVNNLG